MSKELTPEESLGIVSKSILVAKIRNRETGGVFIFWGLLMSFASLAQFLLLRGQYSQYNYYPYFLFPVGAVLTWFLFFRRFKTEKSKNIISAIIPLTWLFIGINFMILSIGYEFFLAELLTPVIIILLSLGISLTGYVMKSKFLIAGGLLCNIAGFVCFKIPWESHGLLFCCVSFVCVVLPGISIKYTTRRDNA